MMSGRLRCIFQLLPTAPHPDPLPVGEGVEFSAQARGEGGKFSTSPSRERSHVVRVRGSVFG